jgi:hypothetical protein
VSYIDDDNNAISRLNNLIKAEEEEQRFWDSMRNTNHDETSKSSSSASVPSVMQEDRRDISGTISTAATSKKPYSKGKSDSSSHQKAPINSKTAATAAVASSGHQPKTATDMAENAKAISKAMNEKEKSETAKSTSEQEAGDDSRRRPKRFDKHHQKDRALRKFSQAGGFS